MPAIVTDLLAAVSASLNRKSELIEHTRRTASVVKKSVVGWVKLVTSGKSSLHGDSNPVPKIQTFSHDRRKLHCQFWCRIEEKGTARLDDSATLLNPVTAPPQILTLGNSVIVAVLVILSDIEGRISENGVNYARLQPSQYFKAFFIEERSVGGGEEWLIHGEIVGVAEVMSRRVFSVAKVKLSYPERATERKERGEGKAGRSEQKRQMRV
jgi:hypothetical protein